MKERKLRKKIREIPIPGPQEEALLRTIWAAKQTGLHPERQRMTKMEFFTGQIGFISGKVWAVKLLVTFLLFLGILEAGLRFDSSVWPLMPVAAPVLCLLNVNELCHICMPGMREILQTARHSLREQLLVRLFIFGFIDGAVCMAGALLASGMTAGLFLQAVLYFAAPFCVMCAGCMAVLGRCRDENALWYCTAWGGFLIVVINMLRSTAIPVYDADWIFGWGMAAVFGIAVTAVETKRFLKNMGGNNSEIIYGTADKTV